MRKTGKVFIIILAAVLVLAGAGVLYVNGKLNRIHYESSEDEAAGSKPQAADSEGIANDAEDVIITADGEKEVREAAEKPEGEVQKQNDIVNLVLIGSDYRIPNTNDRGRGDCTMICSLNTGEGTVKLISIERAVACYVPSRGGYDLITHAFKYDGGELIQQTVEENFLIPVEGYVNVDFDAVITAVDLLGGIDIALDDSEAGAIGAWNYRISEGVYHLDGKHALDFARLRKIDSDWSRVVRQRRTIQAMLNALQGKSLGEMNQLLNEMLPLVNTNLTKGQIARLMLSAPKFLGTTIDSMTIPERDDYWYVERWDHDYCWGIDWEKYSAVVKDFIGS